MQITPSPQLIESLEHLTRYWEECGYSRSYYSRVFLKSLQFGKLSSSDSKERSLISQVQEIASKEEQAQLVEIARNLSRFRNELNAIEKSIHDLFENGEFNKAEALYKDSAGTPYFQVRQNYIELTHRRISNLIVDHKIESAETEAGRCRDLFSEDERLKLAITILVAKANEEKLQHIRFVEAQIEQIAVFLNEYKFEEAAKLQQEIKDEYRIEDYLGLENQFRVKLAKEKFLRELGLLLAKGDFLSADQAFLLSKLLSDAEYFQEKAKFIITTLNQYGEDAHVNDEQALALAHFSDRLLVSARAGSGKTRLLTAKALLLADFEAVHPDNILIMAFNRDAANTVKARIKSLAKTNQTKAFENARTFHSLAYQIVQPSGNLLFDNKGDFVRKEFSEFVQSIFREIATPEFSVRLYEFFRREMASVQRAGALKDNEEYFTYIRNLSYTTLRGEKVKSIGEKYIADFLFEHNLGYAYEKDYLWDKRIYRPDFSLYINKTEYILEHWGIDENDPDKSISGNWDRGWDDYHEEMQKKREYWKERSANNGKKDFILIETSVVDWRNGRKAFEAILKSKLVSKGIVCEKLPEKELVQNVFRIQIDRMTSLLVQFILKAKKKNWNAAETKSQVELLSNANVKTKFFLELGCRVYKSYEDKIQSIRKIDFDELVNQAIQRIHSSKGNLDISTDGSSSRKFKLSELEWLLIDEYQDFSSLFHDLVVAIQKYNPKLKMVCVGDDWQAINSFAGSDLSYFHDFNSFFPNARITSLTTNYRSKSAIVEGGNRVMQGCGNPGRTLLPVNIGGNIFIDDMETVKLIYKNGDTAENNPDLQYLPFDKFEGSSDKLRPNSFMVGKYLKACHKIITSEPNRQKSFVILSRNNQVYGVDLVNFLAKLNSILHSQVNHVGNFLKPNIKVSTVHSFKGLEGDCIILLQACQGYFPSIHPDNKLFEVFGQTEKSVLDEEKRLFYVAVTRARENLFILTENSRKSDFLSSLQAEPFLRLEE